MKCTGPIVGALILSLAAATPIAAQEACEAKTSELEDILSRMRMDAHTAGQVEALMAQAREAHAAGESDRCLEHLAEIESALHLNH